MKIHSSVKKGSHSWIMQRVSAIALIPLVVWLVLSVMQIIQDPINYMPIFFAYPLNVFMGILFIIFALYHGSLGIREVIEDYISCNVKKHFYIIFIHLFSILTAVAVLVAILKLHFIA